MGPGGVGKTTLLRTLGRWNEPMPGFWTRGSVELDGVDLFGGIPLDVARRAVPLLAQKARLYTATVMDNAIAEVGAGHSLSRSQKAEVAHDVLHDLGLWDEFQPHLEEPVLALSIGQQRRLCIARLFAGGARCLLADEPLRDLSTEEVDRVEHLLMRVRERIGLVMVTHNQKEARRMTDLVCLVTAGRMVEATPTEDFFVAPRTELGQSFVQSGNCWPRASDLDARTERDPSKRRRKRAPTAWSRAPRPGGFHWILPGLLGGMQRPGLVNEESADLEALAALHVGLLVSLTEEAFDSRKLEEVSILGQHFPIEDMGVPTTEAATDLCARVSASVDAGTPVVFHCKAGLGRTGTLLACVLVYRGVDPVAAIHRVRCTNPLYIQSAEQLEFIARFARSLDEAGIPPVAGPGPE